MNGTTTELWDDVLDHLLDTHLIAWDGCHKIYMALDEEEAEWFRDNYEHIVEDTAEVMLDTLKKWYDESCFLKFVSGVRHNAEDPNAGFVNLIEQFDPRDPDMESDNEED